MGEHPKLVMCRVNSKVSPTKAVCGYVFILGGIQRFVEET